MSARGEDDDDDEANETAEDGQRSSMAQDAMAFREDRATSNRRLLVKLNNEAGKRNGERLSSF